jgi:hypothetical protein
MRGWKSDLRDRLGDLLHATAHINVANKDDDNDDDELAAQPPVSRPVTTLGATPGTSPKTLSHTETQRRLPQNRGNRHLGFLRAYLYDTLGGALSWRHHLSA